ncbi:MAG: FecR domain-containing protein [Prevotellaceae bacterium]|jgi:ferric-dicitrate binding protein FerR (iron transport regulator)|nr:FecR domain-containing protein [Prevotellaceae bacterium]
MTHTAENHDYSEYKFEDFLGDDFFVSSIKNADADSTEFWIQLKNEGKIDWGEFCAAKNFLESLREYNNSAVSEEESAALWQRIKESNETNKAKSRRKLIRIGSCAAAVVLLITVSYMLRSGFRTEEAQDLRLFARENAVMSESNEIQIVLSDKKTIKIDEAEIDIAYDSEAIKIAHTEVSKKESTQYNQLIVPKGKRSKLTLSDGTKLVVNAGTRVVYPVDFAKDRREIFIDGEIFADVVYVANKAFVVKTADTDIRVLGTKFNVTAYETDRNKQIVLVEGSVEVLKSSESKGVVLKPSEMYDCTEGQSRVYKTDVNLHTSWIEGIFIFESRRMDEVLLRLSRYYGVEIVCETKVADLKCSGKMDLKDNLDDILKGLSFAFPITVEHDKGKYRILKLT